MKKEAKAKKQESKPEPKPEHKQTGGSNMDFIQVPKDIGQGNLRSDIMGVCRAELTKMHWGTSRQQKPKVTIEFILTEDVEGLEPPTTGEKVLEACSLQPQALWKLNQYYKGATEEDIPSQEYTMQSFQDLIEGALIGSKWDLDLTIGADDKGEPRTQIRKAVSV